MRQAARLLGWTTNILMILLATFAGTIVYSIYLVGRPLLLERELPFGEPQAEVSNGVVVVSVPFFFNNTGYYDISDVNVTTCISDYEGTLISDSVTLVPLVAAGCGVELAYTVLNLSISNVTSGNLTYLLFQDGDFRMDTYISLRFAHALFLSVAMTNASMHWGAPLYNFSIGTLIPHFNGTHHLLYTPLSFENHSPFMNITGTMRVDVYNSRDEYVGSGRTLLDVPSGSRYEDPLKIIVEDPLRLTDKGKVHIYFETSMFSFGPLVISYG